MESACTTAQPPGIALDLSGASGNPEDIVNILKARTLWISHDLAV